MKYMKQKLAKSTKEDPNEASNYRSSRTADLYFSFAPAGGRNTGEEGTDTTGNTHACSDDGGEGQTDNRAGKNGGGTG